MELMKSYKYFLKEESTKTIVFAFGRFQCPTIGHSLLVSKVDKTAKSNNADSVIYASKTQDKKKNPLTVEQKIHYLKLMFPHDNFKAANPQERTPIEVAKELNKKYNNLIMVAGSDRVDSFEKLLNQYNGIEYHYGSIKVVSAGERDPDADDASGMSGTKMRNLALDNNFAEFKKGLPHTLKDVDAKQLMNDIRVGMGKDSIREQYFQGNIFNIGDIVESDDTYYRIIMRGSNYLTLEDNLGYKTKKWLQDVTAIYTEKEMNEEEAKKVLYTSSDKVKIARIIAGALGIDDSVTASPDSLINLALRKIKNKPMHSEYIETVKSMLSTADKAGIKYDKKLLSIKMEEANNSAKILTGKKVKSFKQNINPEDTKNTESDFDIPDVDVYGNTSRVGVGIEPDQDKDYLRRQKIIYKLKEEHETAEEDKHEDETDEEIEAMIKDIKDLEDIFDAYEDEELHIVDENGNHISDLKEDYITEVLSRMERMKAKVRFARSASKRERKMKIALHTKSSSEKINHRARTMAVKLLKLKIAKKPLNTLSIQEKERVEQIIKSKGAILKRIAMKLVPRIRTIEGARLHPKSH